ncbi:MAG: DUF1501 domain-containing protein [Polyangiales bacterium]
MSVSPFSRRAFLIGGAASACSLRFTRGARAQSGDAVLVTVFLRGGMDSLGVVAPAADPNYRRLRPDIALPVPPRRGSESAGSIRLDRRFVLHPGMRPLIPHRDELGIVVAAGLPFAIRSHFTAQYVMEHGGARAETTPLEGWLARATAGVTAPIVEMGPSIPHSLEGASALALGARTGRRHESEALFQRLYEPDASPESEIRRTGHVALEMQQRLRRLAPLEQESREQFGPGAFSRSLQYASRLIADSNVRTITLSQGSWDTHRNQVGALNARVRDLASGIASFWQSLGEHQRRVVVLVMSEFGRTVAQNGTAGTDHGYGTAMFVLGQRVRGGVHGRWPGLAESDLYEGRDLQVTTDYRRVLASVANTHLGVPLDALSLAPPGRLELFR